MGLLMTEKVGIDNDGCLYRLLVVWYIAFLWRVVVFA